MYPEFSYSGAMRLLLAGISFFTAYAFTYSIAMLILQRFGVRASARQKSIFTLLVVDTDKNLYQGIITKGQHLGEGGIAAVRKIASKYGNCTFYLSYYHYVVTAYLTIRQSYSCPLPSMLWIKAQSAIDCKTWP